MTNLSNKTALVTGGSRGIGAGIAIRLAADGADVAITYAGNQAAAEATVAAIEAHGRKGLAIKADGADTTALRAGVDAAAAALGGIDILVHNAGTAEFGTIGATSEASYRKMMDLNVDAVFHGTTAALPHMRDGGRILIIGSVNAHTLPFPGVATYGATKAAVAAFAKGWARDLAGRRILVNAIQPGPVDTDLNPASGPFAQVMTPMIALGRYGTVAEVAALTAFLASDEASFITGACIDIDGGFSL
ncbi:oxidoreductase [alpha proteobacterium AAP81b]|nr:oxidoreductase [alpha proteobacterium AAP81b]